MPSNIASAYLPLPLGQDASLRTVHQEVPRKRTNQPLRRSALC